MVVAKDLGMSLPPNNVKVLVVYFVEEVSIGHKIMSVCHDGGETTILSHKHVRNKNQHKNKCK